MWQWSVQKVARHYINAPYLCMDRKPWVIARIHEYKHQKLLITYLRSTCDIRHILHEHEKLSFSDISVIWQQLEGIR